MRYTVSMNANLAPPHEARAHLLEMAGDHRQAAECYRQAASRTGSLPEQRYLLARAALLAIG